MKKTCQVPWCPRDSQGELPEEVGEVNVALCDVHVAYLTARIEEARKAQAPASWVEHVALLEVRALIYPDESTPHLHALPGGQQ